MVAFCERSWSPLVVLVLSSLAVSSAPAAQSDLARPTRSSVQALVDIPQDVQARAETLARSITHFATRAIIANRAPDGRAPSALLIEQVRLQTALQEMSGQPEAVRLLLKHPDPRVRTIALGALFVREEPRDLPFIAALMNDDASTLLDLHDSANQKPGPLPLSEFEGRLTVGQVARSMIQFYLEAAHVLLAEGFDAYWAERKDRAHCASWDLVRLERATRREEPVSARYQPDIDAVMARIDALPSPDREWTLFLATYGLVLPGPRYITSDAALLLAAKRLGPDALMKFLLLKRFSDDPDLNFVGIRSPTAAGVPGPDPRMETFRVISRFVVEHAQDLFRPSDAAAFRENAGSELQFWLSAGPLWRRAADVLQPVREPPAEAARMEAELVGLPSAVGLSQQLRQIGLATDLWHLSGMGASDFLVQWFYTAEPKDWVRVSFVQAVDLEARPESPAVLYAIVADRRFDTTDFVVVKELLGSVGRGLGTPLVEVKEILAHRTNNLQDPVLVSWRNILRRHFGLPERAPAVSP